MPSITLPFAAGRSLEMPCDAETHRISTAMGAAFLALQACPEDEDGHLRLSVLAAFLAKARALVAEAVAHASRCEVAEMTRSGLAGEHDDSILFLASFTVGEALELMMILPLVSFGIAPNRAVAKYRSTFHLITPAFAALAAEPLALCYCEEAAGSILARLVNSQTTR